MSAVTSRQLVDHARWLETTASVWAVLEPPGPEKDARVAQLDARIELAWIAATHANDEERAIVQHDTIPRISVRP